MLDGQRPGRNGLAHMTLSTPSSAPPEPAGPLDPFKRLLARRRARSQAAPGWGLAVSLALAVLALPVLAVVYLAATPDENCAFRNRPKSINGSTLRR